MAVKNMFLLHALPRTSCRMVQGKLQGRRRGAACLLLSQPCQLQSTNFPPQKEAAVQFDSPEVATAGKSTKEILRGWVVFKLLTYDFLVNNSLRLYNISKRVLGRWITEKLLRATIFGQFGGGTDEKDALTTVEKHVKRNISSIWQFSTEQDLHEAPWSTAAILEQEQQYNQVNNTYLKSIEMSASHNCDRPTKFAAVKITAIINPQLLKKLNDLLKMSEEVFHSLASPADDLRERRVMTDTVLKEFPDLVLQPAKESWDLVDWTSYFALPQNVPCLQQLLSKNSACEPLSDLEQEQLDHFMNRLRAIGECASSHGVRVLVDGEQSYFQSAIHHFTLHYLMRQYNSQQPLVYDTLQTYLTSSFDSLLTDLVTAMRYNIKYGVKVVRGAYMEQERKAAAALGYSCPVHPDKPSTDRSYHRAIEHLLNEVASGDVEVMVATHNQETLKFVLAKIHGLGLAHSQGAVTFGQLLGMGDHLTYSLAQAGYLANKIVPYGSLDDIMPYLSRRAQENHGIIVNAQTERFLYARELKRRLWK